MHKIILTTFMAIAFSMHSYSQNISPEILFEAGPKKFYSTAGVRIKAPAEFITKVFVINNKGEIVYKSDLKKGSQHFKIDLSNQTLGDYIFRLLDVENQILSEKKITFEAFRLKK